jgi:1-acyl-sn-glycerol-3-phosphate acyltransferase
MNIWEQLTLEMEKAANEHVMKISKLILKLFGWKVVNVPPDIPKCVIALAPHTSNWDFIIGKLAYSSLGRNAKFLIKKEWFFFPFNLFFKSIGGIPVERDKKNWLTDKLAEEFNKHEKFQLAVTPEGTRKPVKEWRKADYYIALKANVPIVLVGIDYAKKQVIFLDTFIPPAIMKKI